MATTRAACFVFGVTALSLLTLLEGACGSTAARSGFEGTTGDGGTTTTTASPSFPEDGGNQTTSDAPYDGPSCEGTIVPLTRSPVYMLVIMDGSGSMNDPLVTGGPSGLKWQASRDAMDSFIDNAAQAADTSFGLGLFLFDGTQDVADFSGTQIGIDYVDAKHAALLKQRIDGSTPQGGTPLTMAIEGQLNVLETFKPYTPLQLNGRRVLVIMTDGVPDGPDDVQPQVQQQCVDLVQTAHDGPNAITTFAVGIGDPASPDTTYNEVFMGRLAVAGGAPTAGCTPGWNETSPAGSIPCHFQVTPGQQTAAQIRDEMLAAINTIRGEAASCELALTKTDGSPGVPDPSKVNVSFTDSTGKQTEIAKDPVDGWTYNDDANPTSVIIHGKACDKLKAESNGKVDVELGCATRGVN